MTRSDDVWKRAQQMAEDQWLFRETSGVAAWLDEALDRERGDQAYEAARELYGSATNGIVDRKALDELRELWIEYASDKLYGAAAAELQDEAEAFMETINEARREEARQSGIRG